MAVSKCQSMQDVLKRVSAELSLQARQLEHVEQAIGALAERVTVLDPDVLLELQHVDAVRQTMEALAAFSGELADLVSSGWAVDATTAVGRIQLSALAGRLNGEGNDVLSSERHHLDHVELFD